MESQSQELLTNSRASCFRRCKREHFYRYELCRRSTARPAPLDFGTIFHAAIEAWRTLLLEEQWGRSVGALTPLAAGLFRINTEWQGLPETSELDEFDRVDLEEMLRGYHARWYEEDLQGRFLMIERSFRVPLRNPETNRISRNWGLAGVFDAVISRGEQGWFVENKTTSSSLDPAGDYWPRLRIDPQVSTYYSALDELDIKIAGCIYDVARKPSQKPLRATPETDRKYTKGIPCKTCKQLANQSSCQDCGGTGWKEAPHLYANQRDQDESIDEYRARVRAAILADPDGFFRRAEIVRLDEEVREHRADFWLTAREMADAKRLSAHPRNPDACVRYGRLCEFWPVCTGEATIFDEGRYEDAPKHPELAKQ